MLKAISDLSIDIFNSRDEVDLQLSKSLKDIRLRQFLLKNLKRNSKNEFYWTFNIQSIRNNLYEILLNSSIDKNTEIRTPTLFIKGENSNYIPYEHFEMIKSTFINSNVIVIKNAGHWVHAENQNDFIESVKTFLM